MLPHVNAKDGDLAADNRVLVLGGDDAQALRVLDKPAPAAPLQAKKSLVKVALEGVEAAPRALDGADKLGGAVRVCIGGGGGSKILPEKRVVDVAAAVEPNGRLEGNLLGDVVVRGGVCVRLEGDVQVVDIGLMVLAVVQLHDLGRDAGLESLVCLAADSTWKTRHTL